jgi:mono/diheme cytochrome c family protein
MNNFFYGFALALLALMPLGSQADERSAVEVGRERYLNRCGICHGVDARGDGPFTEFLKKAPPDLTKLEANNNGHFPFHWVYLSIDGSELPPAHGTREMPIWSREFLKIAPDADATAVRGRILELILYLNAIQEP